MIRGYTIFLLICALLLGFAVKTVFFKPHKGYTEEQLAQMITPKELGHFLETWVEYTQSDVRELEQHQSLSAGLPSKTAPKRFQSWIKKRDWDVDRFFYVEQRLQMVLKMAIIREQSNQMIEGLQTRLKNSSNAESSSVKKLIDQKNDSQKINVEHISDEEIKMVIPHIAVIKKILEN